MPSSGPASPPGVVGSLRALGDDLVVGTRDRLALLSLELQEEKWRLVQTLAWLSAAILFGILALGFTSLTLIQAFPESDRLAVLVGLTAFYLAGTAGLVLGLRQFLARQPRPFSATLEELDRDRACFRREH